MCHDVVSRSWATGHTPGLLKIPEMSFCFLKIPERILPESPNGPRDPSRGSTGSGDDDDFLMFVPQTIELEAGTK